MLPVLDRSFLKELLYNMAFALAVITAVFFTGAAVKFLHKYPDLDLLMLFQILPFFLLYHLEFVLPLSLLVAVVLVYGRAAAANEITTIKASGIHPYRILLPAFLIAGLVSVVSAYSSNSLSPRAEENFKALLSDQDNIRRLFEKTIAKGRQQIEFARISISWREAQFPPEGGLVLLDSLLQKELDYKKQRKLGVPFQIVQADRLIIRFDVHSSSIRLEAPVARVLEGDARGQKIKDFVASYRIGGDDWARRLRYYTGAELVCLYQRAQEEEALGGQPYRASSEIRAKIHERLSLATSSLFFVLIGAPLALVFKAGNRLVAFLLAFFVVLFVFYPSQLMAQTLTDQEVVHPVIAAWSGSMLLAFLGLGLLLFVVRR